MRPLFGALALACVGKRVYRPLPVGRSCAAAVAHRRASPSCWSGKRVVVWLCPRRICSGSAMEPRFNERVVFHRGPGHRHSARTVTEVIVHRRVMMTSLSHTEGDDGVTGKRRGDCKGSRPNDQDSNHNRHRAVADRSLLSSVLLCAGETGRRYLWICCGQAARDGSLYQKRSESG